MDESVHKIVSSNWICMASLTFVASSASKSAPHYSSRGIVVALSGANRDFEQSRSVLRWLSVLTQVIKMQAPYARVEASLNPNNSIDLQLLNGITQRLTLTYGACIFIHCVSTDNQRSTLLLCSKSRTNPSGYGGYGLSSGLSANSRHC
jgi:hypothetical protein